MKLTNRFLYLGLLLSTTAAHASGYEFPGSKIQVVDDLTGQAVVSSQIKVIYTYQFFGCMTDHLPEPTWCIAESDEALLTTDSEGTVIVPQMSIKREHTMTRKPQLELFLVEDEHLHAHEVDLSLEDLKGSSSGIVARLKKLY